MTDASRSAPPRPDPGVPAAGPMVAADSPRTVGRPALTWFIIVALALSVLVGVAVGAPDYLPTNDGPSHVFANHAALHLDDPGPGYGRYLKLGATFSPIGFGRLFAFWERFFSWREALRASLVVMVLLWSWGVVVLAAAVGGRRRIWLGLFGFAAAVQWQLYMGFFAFYLATGFGFYVLALAFWRSQASIRWDLALGAGLLCQALFHPVPALASALVISLLVAWRPPRGKLLGKAGRLALILSPTLLVVLAAADPNDRDVGFEFLPLAEQARLAVSAFVSGPAWRCWIFPLCAVTGGVLAVVGRHWREDPRRGALILSGLTFALVATLGPLHVPGWQFFSMRFSPLAAVLLTLVLPVERWPVTIRTTGLVLLVLYAGSSNLWAWGYNVKLRRESDDLLSGLAAPIRRSGMRLPLIIEPRAGELQRKPSRTVPYCTANWNIGSLYAVAQGGVPAWTFADSGIHAVVWRWPEQHGLRPPRPDRGFEWSLSEPRVLATPGARKAAVSHLLSYAPYYEDVIFYGRPEEVAWLRERRFDIDYERGGLAIARFHACPAELEITPGDHGHASTVIQFGWAPSTEITLATTLPADPDAQGPRRWPVPESPCGEVWFRVLFDNDGDGLLSSGDSLCIEATPYGVVPAHIEPTSNRVLCHPGPRRNVPTLPSGQ